MHVNAVTGLYHADQQLRAGSRQPFVSKVLIGLYQSAFWP
jgi:hypothetical protein